GVPGPKGRVGHGKPVMTATLGRCLGCEAQGPRRHSQVRALGSDSDYEGLSHNLVRNEDAQVVVEENHSAVRASLKASSPPGRRFCRLICRTCWTATNVGLGIAGEGHGVPG